MERMEFLRRLGMGSLAVPYFISCASSADPEPAADTSSATSGSCTVTPSETAGPFPTKSPASLVLTDIRSDRTGVPLTVEITIQNKNNNCSPLEGVIVDIWHCDKDGYYSEYGGTGMQSVNLTAAHFLRGRQTTNSNGKSRFHHHIPRLVRGRSTHIHVHIYSAAGNSLLVTQIAFPEGAGSAVSLVNASSANGYTKGLSGYTYNASDNVFSDSVSEELATISGNLTSGFALSHTIVVNA